jgi:hypothetical protein
VTRAADVRVGQALAIEDFAFYGLLDDHRL